MKEKDFLKIFCKVYYNNFLMKFKTFMKRRNSNFNKNKKFIHNNNNNLEKNLMN